MASADDQAQDVVVALVIAVEWLRRPSRERLRVAASQTVWLLSGAFAVYAAGWWLHLALLPEAGDALIL